MNAVLGRSRPSVSRQISNYDLLSYWVPEIVNPKAAFGVSRVTAVLDVPIRRMSFPLPLEIKLILAAMIIVDLPKDALAVVLDAPEIMLPMRVVVLGEAVEGANL